MSTTPTSFDSPTDVKVAPTAARPHSTKLSGRNLVWTINFVAGLAIFLCVYPLPVLLPTLTDECYSFGYDQGMMGGVNTSPDYVTTMGLGYITCVDHMS